jgi:hypothetical protein
MKKLIFVTILVSSGFVNADDLGGNSSGGGSPAAVRAGALKLLITGGGLKNAMLNYLKSIPLEQVQDEEVKTNLQKLPLADDIATSEYFIADVNQCVDRFDKKVPASTEIGKPGARICFDVVKLVEDYKNLSEEETMIRLAGLAFHEHVHHFQVLGDKNEDEANKIGGYVLVTAKYTQIPVLEWSMDSENEDEEIKLLPLHLGSKAAIELSEKARFEAKIIKTFNQEELKAKTESQRKLLRIKKARLQDDLYMYVWDIVGGLPYPAGCLVKTNYYTRDESAVYEISDGKDFEVGLGNYRAQLSVYDSQNKKEKNYFVLTLEENNEARSKTHVQWIGFVIDPSAGGRIVKLLAADEDTGKIPAGCR